MSGLRSLYVCAGCIASPMMYTAWEADTSPDLDHLDLCFDFSYSLHSFAVHKAKHESSADQHEMILLVSSQEYRHFTARNHHEPIPWTSVVRDTEVVRLCSKFGVLCKAPMNCHTQSVNYARPMGVTRTAHGRHRVYSCFYLRDARRVRKYVLYVMGSESWASLKPYLWQLFLEHLHPILLRSFL